MTEAALTTVSSRLVTGPLTRIMCVLLPGAAVVTSERRCAILSQVWDFVRAEVYFRKVEVEEELKYTF